MSAWLARFEERRTHVLRHLQEHEAAEWTRCAHCRPSAPTRMSRRSPPARVRLEPFMQATKWLANLQAEIEILGKNGALCAGRVSVVWGADSGADVRTGQEGRLLGLCQR
jgi:hypothetical protein